MKTIDSFDNKNNYIEYENNWDKDKKSWPEKYLDMIRPYLKDMINDQKSPMKLRVHSGNKVINYETQFGEWKIQLKMLINFFSSTDFRETRTMRTKSDNIEIMMGSKANNIIEKLKKSLLQNYQKLLEESMTGSRFIFDSVNLLYYTLQKISLKRGGS